jgi:hypothetical protein
VIGPVPGQKYSEITFPILAPDPATKDVHFLKYPIYVGGNRGRGQIYPEETPQPYLIFVFFVFTLTVATQTTGSVKCKTSLLRYPFGFSDGYPIRFNCSEITGEAVIGEFAVQEVTNSNIYVEIPPVCKRNIRKIEQLFRENLAPSKLQNIILVQGCKKQNKSSNCLIRNKFVENRLNLSKCKSPVSCLDGATTTTADVMSLGDVVNGSGCKYWFSSISQSQVSVNLGRLKLDWWLKGSCSNTTCSENADCAKVKLDDGGLGHRCTCREGFSGKAFTVPGGCHRLGSFRSLTFVFQS